MTDTEPPSQDPIPMRVWALAYIAANVVTAAAKIDAEGWAAWLAVMLTTMAIAAAWKWWR